MGIFSTSSPLDALVEKATSEKNTGDDWGTIMELCDKVKDSENGHIDGMRAISKRLKNDNPRVVLQTITLLDACVNNCGRRFHLKVAEREFEQELNRMLVNRHTHHKVSEKLRECLKKWAEGDFKNDAELSLIPALYRKLVSEGYSFSVDAETQPKKTSFSNDPNVVNTQQEEDDIARAIELSLKENGSSSYKGASKIEPSSLYSPAVSALSDFASLPPPDVPKESKKVRALYDFEAAEDNELTFKSGEIVFVLDNSDPNWWKGSNHRGEGLFPSNFVTEDLEADEFGQEAASAKKVSFSESVEVTEVLDPESEPTGEVDAEKIDQLLHLLHDADPTGETSDDATLPILEDQVNAMAPTIDAELEQIDRRHAQLARLGTDLGNALELYQQLMREMPAAMPYYMPYNNPMQPPMHNQPYNPATDLPPSYMNAAVPPPMPHMYPMAGHQQPYMPNATMAPSESYPHNPNVEPHVSMPQPQLVPDGLPVASNSISSSTNGPLDNYAYAMYASLPDQQGIYTQASHGMMPYQIPNQPSVSSPLPQTMPHGQPGYPPIPQSSGPSSVPYYSKSMQQPLL